MNEWMGNKNPDILKGWEKIVKRGYVFAVCLWCCFKQKKLNLFFFFLLVGVFFHTLRQYCDSLGQTWHLAATSRETVLLFLLSLCFSTPRPLLFISTRNNVACLPGWNLFFFLAGFTTYANANTREKQLQSVWTENELVPFRSGCSWVTLNRWWNSYFRKTYWEAQDALARSLHVISSQ